MRLLCAIVILFDCMKMLSAQSVLSEARLAQISRSVVRVSGTNCASQSRVVTGFIWAEKDKVVTALHVVNGCDNVSVYSEFAAKTRVGHVFKVLAQKDLVLLKIDNPLDL